MAAAKSGTRGGRRGFAGERRRCAALSASAGVTLAIAPPGGHLGYLGGAVPDDMESLLALPGVARKTANVVLGNAFAINVGVVVDKNLKI